MAPEHEARARVLYDHENDKPRRRHAVADWGVGEDVFDRMPSRRFTRAERRAESHRPPARRMAPGESRTIVIGRVDDELEAFEAPGPRAARDDGEPAAGRAVTTGAGDGVRAAARVVTGADAARPAARAVATGADDEAHAAAAGGRRTVVIKGHPERLPAARPPRPRSAIERVGTSPDRIVAYAVALGFLLALIAVLTTGQ